MERACGVDVLPRAARVRPAEQAAPPEPEGWAEFRRQVESCTKCGLARTRTQAVFGVGPLGAPLMFVGEAPGNDEDAQGEPFVGRAGQLLNRALREIGVAREAVYITNIVRCRPPDPRQRGKVRAPSPEEVQACFPYLVRHIRYVGPRIICALGGPAAQALLNTKASITALRGKTFEVLGWKVFPTYHPAFLLRSPQYLAVWKGDVREACRLAGLIAGA
jgi:DNA polymerase